MVLFLSVPRYGPTITTPGITLTLRTFVQGNKKILISPGNFIAIIG
jgi:hypothetical protein